MRMGRVSRRDTEAGEFHDDHYGLRAPVGHRRI
jgi:hypothetical protein